MFSRLLVIVGLNDCTSENNYNWVGLIHYTKEELQAAAGLLSRWHDTKKKPPSHITNPSGKATQIIQRHRLNPGMTLVGPKDKVLKTLDLSFCLSLHTRMKVSKTTSAAWDTASEISKLMSRGFRNMLLLLRLWDWATVSSVSLLTS